MTKSSHIPTCFDIVEHHDQKLLYIKKIRFKTRSELLNNNKGSVVLIIELVNPTIKNYTPKYTLIILSYADESIKKVHEKQERSKYEEELTLQITTKMLSRLIYRKWRQHFRNI